MAANFIGYLIGYLIAIIGVGFLMHAAGIGQQWIIAAVLILIGLGVVWALSRSQSGTPNNERTTPPQNTEHSEANRTNPPA
jgi:predicted lipid-binding transport protein (Tim44 family)